MIALDLLYASLTVGDLEKAGEFYTNALGFVAVDSISQDSQVLARALGALSMQTLKLKRGQQFLELVRFHPPSAPYPTIRLSNDLFFQHCALVTHDIMDAYHRLTDYDFIPISHEGPQTLPGGIRAFKFRDADGHPLELIQFPKSNPVTHGGIDHIAISVANADQSISFYNHKLGLTLSARQTNTGLVQDALDGLKHTIVEVVAMTPQKTSPHLELLDYQSPRRHLNRPVSLIEKSLSRIVFKVNTLDDIPEAFILENGTHAALISDPDGRALLLRT